MTSAKGNDGWSRSDAEAEVDRILRGAPGVRETVEKIRAIGELSGFKDVADEGVDSLRTTLEGEGLGAVYGAFSVASALQAADTANAELDRAKKKLEAEQGWWASVAEGNVFREEAGLYPLGFANAWPEDRSATFVLSASPDVTFGPLWLVVDPEIGAGKLQDIRVGHTSLLIGGEVPLSMFNPRNWRDVDAMRLACRFPRIKVSPAHRICIMGEMTQLGPVRMVLLGRAYDCDGRPFDEPAKRESFEEKRAPLVGRGVDTDPYASTGDAHYVHKPAPISTFRCGSSGGK